MLVEFLVLGLFAPLLKLLRLESRGLGSYRHISVTKQRVFRTDQYMFVLCITLTSFTFCVHYKVNCKVLKSFVFISSDNVFFVSQNRATCCICGY